MNLLNMASTAFEQSPLRAFSVFPKPFAFCPVREHDFRALSVKTTLSKALADSF